MIEVLHWYAALFPLALSLAGLFALTYAMIGAANGYIQEIDRTPLWEKILITLILGFAFWAVTAVPVWLGLVIFGKW